MTADQIELQLPGLLRWDANVGQLAEPRIHSIDGLSVRHRRFDRVTRRYDAPQGGWIEGDRGEVPGDGDDVGNREGMAVEGNGRWHDAGKLLGAREDRTPAPRLAA